MAKSILLAEDSDDSVTLFQFVLKRNRIENPLNVVHDGLEAVAYLGGEGQFADRANFPLPGIVCLDLRMPRLDGFGVLAWLKSHPAVKTGILTIVLSEDTSPEKVRQAMDLGADSVLSKPFVSTDLARLIQQFGGYWVQASSP